MGQIVVRNIEDGVMNGLRELARRRGSSMEAEVRALIAAEVERDAALRGSRCTTRSTSHSRGASTLSSSRPTTDWCARARTRPTGLYVCRARSEPAGGGSAARCRTERSGGSAAPGIRVGGSAALLELRFDQ
jgi:plasmid stability protein